MAWVKALFQRAQEQAYFIGAVNTLAQAGWSGAGGVLIQDAAFCSARRVSGDTSDNDEICAVAASSAG